MTQYPSVSQVVGNIKATLESQFRLVTTEGEVSNLSRSGAGHWYFSLSDSEASLSCALFKMDALRNPEIKNLKDGDKIIVAGPISVYSRRGTFQLIAKRISRAGKGDLKEEFEKLKKRLAAEGLFDLEVKKPIPSFPRRVAVITAEQGAALQDFLGIVERRAGLMDIVVVPALVQGINAPASIRQALHNAIKYSLNAEEDKKFDVIVITRGGGSMEDLWAFNDEALAWDIYNCPLPVISAVGHQVDYTICDFVADMRMETPSAAAELITQEGVMIEQRLERAKRSLTLQAQTMTKNYENRLSQSHPRRITEKLWNWFYQRQKRLSSLDISKRLWELTNIHEFQQRLDDSSKRLENIIKSQLKEKHVGLENSMDVLRALNPDNVLGRGYSYLKAGDSVIGSFERFKNLKENELLQIKFSDGVGTVSKVK